LNQLPCYLRTSCCCGELSSNIWSCSALVLVKQKEKIFKERKIIIWSETYGLHYPPEFIRLRFNTSQDNVKLWDTKYVKKENMVLWELFFWNASSHLSIIMVIWTHVSERCWLLNCGNKMNGGSYSQGRQIMCFDPTKNVTCDLINK
jgi:hypothetical protein